MHPQGAWQLTARIPPTLLLSFLGVLISLELFLAFSETPALKAGSCLLFLASLFLIAVQHWDRSLTASALLFSIFFGVYLSSAASRYPGLMKEPMPFLFTDVFGLMARGWILMVTSMVVSHLLWVASRSLYLRLLRQVRPKPSELHS